MGRRECRRGSAECKPEPVARGMAEHPQYRPYRAEEPQSADARRPREGSDPLTELARLIGQEDQYPLSKSAQPRDARDTPSQADDRAAPDWLTRSSPQHNAHQDPFDTFPQRATRDAYSDPRSSPDRYDRSGRDPRDRDEYAAFGQQRGYGDDPYYAQDGHMPPHAGDLYDEAPREPRRRGVTIVTLVVGLAVIGTAGTFSYRALTGPPGTNGRTPVIMADAGPNKIVPAAPASDNQQSKMTYDRVADRGQGERVVSREEQPVELKDSSRAAPRVVLPGGVPVPTPPCMEPAVTAGGDRHIDERIARSRRRSE